MRIFSIFSANFLFSLHYATTLYVNSSFLSQFFSPLVVSGLYIGGSIFNIFLFLKAPRLVRFLGGKLFLLTFLTLSLFSILALALGDTALLIATAFIFYMGVSMMVYYALDLFLEKSSTESRTGGVRGAFLTTMNLAILGGPFIVMLVENFDSLYLLSGAVTLPIFLLALFFLSGETDTRNISIELPWQEWLKPGTVKSVTLARFSLEFFYGLMTIFVPIYLNVHLGFTWAEIGRAFFIMLLPFVLLEWPTGIIADKKIGEKEFMIAGFSIIIIALCFMPLLGGNLLFWSIVLLLSRVGASLAEITTESHFFKHVNERDAGLISIFRLTRPLSIIFGAFLGGILVLFWPYQYIFYLLIASALIGLWYSLKIVDTR